MPGGVSLSQITGGRNSSPVSNHVGHNKSSLLLNNGSKPNELVNGNEPRPVYADDVQVTSSLCARACSFCYHFLPALTPGSDALRGDARCSDWLMTSRTRALIRNRCCITRARVHDHAAGY